MNEVGLKRPVGIYVLAVLFILAPLGNILISFAGAGVANWYEPSVFTVFLQSIPLVDWVWLSLLVLTGVLLFRPHKLSWSVAIATLVIILLINVYRMFSSDASSIAPQYFKVFSIISLFCTLGVLVIAFYFRFPYLDRRANWIKNIERYDLATDIEWKGQIVKTESISVTGCKIAIQNRPHIRPNDATDVMFMEIYDKPVKCIVVETNSTFVRLEFAPGQDKFMGQLKAWIKSKTGA